MGWIAVLILTIPGSIAMTSVGPFNNVERCEAFGRTWVARHQVNNPTANVGGRRFDCIDALSYGD